MKITLAEPLKRWVDLQIAEGGHQTASEFIEKLLRAERRRQTKALIDQKLLDALDSGPAVPVTPQEWEARTRRVLNRGKSRRRKASHG